MHIRAGLTGGTAVVVISSVALALGLAVPAVADTDDIPSWSDVEEAKLDEVSTQAEIDTIVSVIGDLEVEAAEYAQTAQARAEEYQIANDALETATGKATDLAAQAEAATAQAAESSQQAGQLVARIARTGGGSITMELLLGGDDTDELLDELGTVTKLTSQAQEIYEQAQIDKNAATALTNQAKVAEEKRAAQAQTATDAFSSAEAASLTAQERVAEQTAASDQLYAQLASLKGTTAEVEREYLAEVARQAAEAALGVDSETDTGTSSSGTSSSGTSGSSTDSSVSGSAATSTVPSTTTGTTTPTVTTPTVTTPTVTTPTVTTPAVTTPAVTTPTVTSASVAASAIAYAKAQLGEPYLLNGSGPSSWDCSGLTKVSYSSAGVYIGTHSSTNQYNTMQSAGKLVSVKNLVAGDLLFYSTGGSTSAEKYHVAMYIGNGQMIEAPYAGQVVRIVTVRTSDLVAYAGRPTP